MTEYRNQFEDREYDALMSAAPDLLAACEAALFCIEEAPGAFSSTEEALAYISKTVMELRAAIAKAKGER